MLSMLPPPLIAQGSTLGFLVCVRKPGYRSFDAYDQEIGMEFASRAAMFIDNARRYNREHATALTLQRSLLPTGLSYCSSVDVRHRYLPGSKLIEVGGRVDRAARRPGRAGGRGRGRGRRPGTVTHGPWRRTAIHLARLELPPAGRVAGPADADTLANRLNRTSCRTCVSLLLRHGQRQHRGWAPRRRWSGRTAATSTSTSRPLRRWRG